MLYHDFYSTLVIDCTVAQKLRIPGSRSCNALGQLNPTKVDAGNGFAAPSTETDTIHMEETIVLVDESGSPDGKANELRQFLLERGVSCFVLEGGLSVFFALYPDMDKTLSPPTISEIDPTKCPVPVLDAQVPLWALVRKQQQLVNAVWCYNKDPGDMPQEIVPGLFLSSYLATSPEKLASADITHLIRLGWGFKLNYPCSVHDFPIEDGVHQPVDDLLVITSNLIHDLLQSGKRVLVHCHAGVSRSSTVVLAYLVSYCSMSLLQAWNHTFAIRPIIRPNHGFSEALLKIEFQKRQTNSLSIYWMAESYLLYVDVFDFFYRYSACKI
ncbi:protein-tyrosine phosphatase-like protein, partial [Gorgonomyces haynaldii]